MSVRERLTGSPEERRVEADFVAARWVCKEVSHRCWWSGGGDLSTQDWALGYVKP